MAGTINLALAWVLKRVIHLIDSILHHTGIRIFALSRLYKKPPEFYTQFKYVKTPANLP